MQIVAIITVVVAGLVSVALVFGGIRAIRFGYRLFRDGVGIKVAAENIEVQSEKLKIKFGTVSAGAFLMLTAFGWGWLAKEALPDLETAEYVISKLPGSASVAVATVIVEPMPERLMPERLLSGLYIKKAIHLALEGPKVISIIPIIPDRVFFGLGQTRVPAEGYKIIPRIIALMKKFPGLKMIVQGHADEPGSADYNFTLGEKRAKAVQRYMIDHGVEPKRITTVSYGNQRRVRLGDNEVAWSQNRRVVFVVN